MRVIVQRGARLKFRGHTRTPDATEVPGFILHEVLLPATRSQLRNRRLLRPDRIGILVISRSLQSFQPVSLCGSDQSLQQQTSW